MTLDPPSHTRLREILSPLVSRGNMAKHGPILASRAEELLIEMISIGPVADIVRDYVEPPATEIMCRMLAIPAEDSGQFRSWSDAALMSPTSDTLHRDEIGWAHLREYVRPFLKFRQRKSANDLLTVIASAQSPDKVTEFEALLLVATVIITGHDTTISGMSSCLLHLSLHTEITRSVAARPDSVRAVEELVRLIPAGDGSFTSIAWVDVTLPSGIISAGKAVLTPVTAANHDAARFPQPEKFVLRRPESSTFGFGLHRCLGTALATLELQISAQVYCNLLPDACLAVERSELADETQRLSASPGQRAS